MSRDLDQDLKTLRTVLDYAQKRDFERAAALAGQTIAGGFEHPMLLNVIATQREREGNLEESLRLLDRAVAIAPGDVGARNALALCLQRLDRPAEALQHTEVLLKTNPNLAFVHANRGNALIAIGALGRAKESHLQALQLEPHNLAALLALAAIATQRGEHAEAREWAQRALKLSPGYPDAVMSMAAADLAEGSLGSAEDMLHQVILDSRAGAWDRARATGLLGDVLDAGARYAEAFDAYQTCNQALLSVHRRFAVGTRASVYARATTRALSDVAAARWRMSPARCAAEPATHVFLVGFPRSGTTLLEVVLDGHPQVVSLEEHELLNEGVLKYLHEPLDLAPLAEADESQLRPYREAYWQAARAAGAEFAGKVFIDKYPLNTLKLPLIAKLFPDAKILFACRDPRDVVLSCFRRRFRMNPAMYELLTLEGAAKFYDAAMQLAQVAQERLSLNVRRVRYETVVADFSGETRAICEFLGIAWTAELGDFGARVRAREHATPSTAQLSQGLNSKGLEQWRHYAAQIREVIPVLEPWIKHFGYTP